MHLNADGSGLASDAAVAVASNGSKRSADSVGGVEDVGRGRRKAARPNYALLNGD